MKLDKFTLENIYFSLMLKLRLNLVFMIINRRKNINFLRINVKWETQGDFMTNHWEKDNKCWFNCRFSYHNQLLKTYHF